MASLIEGFSYDIFISYRQKDNKYDGWVTEFVDNLKRELEAMFKDEVSVYFDINPSDYLLETYDVDASLKEKLKCLVFIPVISRTYCDPKSFAWEHEFKAFIEQASHDYIGLKVTLANGNVANRLLPVRINDLDSSDIELCESVMGTTLRGVDFIYKEPGVNRPLSSNEVDPRNNLNHTFYRNQINKVALGIKDIIEGIMRISEGEMTPVKEIPGEKKSKAHEESVSGKHESDDLNDELNNVKHEPDDIVENKEDASASKSLARKFNKSFSYFLIILVCLLILAVVGFFIKRNNDKQIALNDTLPSLNEEIRYINQTEGKKNWEVYQKLLGINKNLRKRPEFNELWNSVTFSLTINTNIPAAKVYAKPYSNPDTLWYYLGKTPLQNYMFPKGLSRIKIEKPDYETQYDIVMKFFQSTSSGDTLHYRLFKRDEVPEDMVFIPGQMADNGSTPYLPLVFRGDYWMDRFEVTNAQYKTFLDSGGYKNPVYWKFPFVDGKDTIPFEIAKNRFRDKTGWYGPVNWEMGDIPKGEEDLPVTGISWYEAAAYASFVRKDLPTIFHWVSISMPHAAPEIIKLANFDSKGPAKKGTFNSMTRYGTFDLPGNVSEWIYNSNGNNRLVIGGNYREPSYLYNMRVSISPWTRNDLIGFRCIRYVNDTLKQQLTQNFKQPNRDYQNLQPVSDEVFEVYKELFKLNDPDLDPVIISKSESTYWTEETVSIDVPYENAPMKILLFIPVDYKPPYQTIVYMPGINAIYSNSMDDMSTDNIDFFIKSGRAVVWPVYYSTFGRGAIKPTNLYTWKQVHKNIMIDFQIACDYLQTRNDIDTDKLAYFGVSWGGALAAYLLAIDDKIKLGILSLFGISSLEKYTYKEFDQIDYVPHIKIPMLLLGGRYDPDYVMEQQKAFYDFLGTPESNKKWIIYESTHWIPREDLINESLSWLDKYFGPPPG